MTEAIARSLYKMPQLQESIDGVVANPVPPLTYGPEFYAGNDVFERRKDWLVGLGLETDHSVLVVGCGYGGLNDALLNAGISSVYGLEPGSWIWDGLHLQSDQIGNDWVGSGTERSILANLGAPDTFDYVIDDDAAAFHDDTELPAFTASLEDLAKDNSQIVHLVSALIIEQGPGDSALNPKTLDQWKSVAPGHQWESAANVFRAWDPH